MEKAFFGKQLEEGSMEEAADHREIIQAAAARQLAGWLSKSTWYRLETGRIPSAGEFPRAFRFAGMIHRKFYRVIDVRAWVRAQLEAAK
jgi:hypothetical protein